MLDLSQGVISVTRLFRFSDTAARFGHNEHGKPIRPTPAEVQTIIEQQAERMIDMNEDELRGAVAKYAHDFGSKAAAQVERYVRLQQHSR